MAKQKFEVGIKNVLINPKGLHRLKDFQVELTQEFCPKDKGDLKKSIKGVVIGNSIIVGTDDPKAKHVEFGTARMIQAHGPHDPKNPVKTWEAKTKRGDSSSLQQMPFMRPAAFHTAKEVRRILPKKVRMKVKMVMR